MKKGLVLFFLTLSVFFVLSLDLTLRGEAEAGPPNEVVIHTIGDVTGPYAPFTGAAGVFAMKDMEKIINSLGGIKGVKIKFIYDDTRNKRDMALSHYARISAEKPVVVVLQQVADAEMLKERLAEDKIPGLATGASPKMVWPPGWIFPAVPEYPDQFAHFLDWLRNSWKKEGKIKIALVIRDDPVGHANFSPEVDDYLKKKGIDVVAKELFPPWELDLTTQLSRVAVHKPDVVYTPSIAGQNRVVLKAAQAANLIDSTLFANFGWGLDRGAAKLCEGLMEGMVGSQPFWASSDTQVSIVKDILRIFKEEKRDPEKLTSAYAGVCFMNALVAELMIKTVERVGWDKLTGQEIYKTLLESKGFNIMGFMPYSIARGKRAPGFSRIVKIKNGEPVPITDWTPCPDMRPANYK